MPATVGEPPLPPRELMAAVGHELDHNLEFAFVMVGAYLKEAVEGLLGPGWSWEGRRALDFGCGSGRLLRHLLDEARVAEIHGCDIGEEMVAWARESLCPPIASVRVNGPAPPLPFPEDQFDLVIATSVFTHIADGWSDWLLEVRRVLKPGGLLVSTFLDESFSRQVSPIPWDEDRVGMSVLGFADPEMSWPNVLHSHWWLREHWGRAFEVVELVPGRDLPDQEGRPWPFHGWLVLRAREGDLSPYDLERERPDDPRYAAAHRYQLELLRAEGERLRRRFARRRSPRWARPAVRRARALAGRLVPRD